MAFILIVLYKEPYWGFIHRKMTELLYVLYFFCVVTGCVTIHPVCQYNKDVKDLLFYFQQRVPGCNTNTSGLLQHLNPFLVLQDLSRKHLTSVICTSVHICGKFPRSLTKHSVCRH